MTWHYLDDNCEPCTYSPEPAGASSPTCCSDTAPSALSKLIPTAGVCCSPANETGTSHDSRSGMTCRPSTAGPGVGRSTSSPEGSHAPTFHALGRGPASRESSPASGEKWPASFARYDRASSSWRTAQCSLLGGFIEFSETWPRWGLMRGGECWELSTPVRRTSGSGSGFWPTATARDWRSGKASAETMAKNSRPLSEVVVSGMLPTPSATSYGTNQGGSAGRVGKVRPSLQTMTRRGLWPTPQSRDHRIGEAKRLDQPERHGASNLNDQVAASDGGGSLNPTWVEWLMGWPRGWTDLAPQPPDALEQWAASGWWDDEPQGVPRVASDVPERVARLRALGNGQVPACAALAWRILS